MNDYNKIPEELKQMNHWVCWGAEGENPKIPYNPITGYKAKANDMGTWTTFEKARKAVTEGRYKGIGFEFADGVVGVDLDHCIEDGEISPAARYVTNRFDSYTEISQSGTGIHILCRGKLPGNAIKTKEIELYDTGRYFALTGNVYENRVKLKDAQAVIDELYATLAEQRTKPEPAEKPTQGAAPSLSLQDNEVIDIAMRSENGEVFEKLYNGQWESLMRYPSISEADLALCNNLAFFCGKNAEQMDRIFRSSGLMREKWDEKRARTTYGAITIQRAIEGVTDVYSPQGGKERKAHTGETENQSANDMFFDGKKFLHNVMGDYLTKNYGVCKINGSIHIYDDGIYKQGEENLHGHMIKLIPTLTDTKRKEVYKYIKANLDTPEKELAPPYLIPFATKIYDLKNDCFFNYSPEHVFLNRFPYDYNPTAPVMDKVTGTISKIAGDDEEIIKLLYEAMGNCFFLLNSFRGAVMLYGRSGSNGKSTLLNMITQMLGKENASFLSLQDTAERFRLTEVYGKAANIGDDIPAGYLPDSAIFKKLVTGEQIIAEKKGQDPFSFKPYAKMFFALNNLPPVSDKSKAFFSRILLIPLNQDFSQGGLRDVGLKDRKWTLEEMECLTRLAMDGLKRLIRQGDFTKPDCVVQAVAEYESENNPIKDFLEEYGAVEGKPTQQVYTDFRYWCMDNGHKNILTRKNFTKEVCQQTGMRSESIRHPYFDGKTGRCFVASLMSDTLL